MKKKSLAIRFSKHALQRAKERKLWRYVNKEKVYYDAHLFDFDRLVLDECVYVVVTTKEQMVIKTMYKR